MDFFTTFEWAVPHAFADAVSLCRFEEGDVLYDTSIAYEGNWGNSIKQVTHYLQVMFPVRATTGDKDKAGGVFEKNWNSELRLDLFKHQEHVGIGQIHTTQGRLYTALWKGDLSVLNSNSKEPPIPLNVRNVTKQLKMVGIPFELSKENTIFIMVRDQSNPTSKEKYLKVHSKLKKHLSTSHLILTPKVVGFNNWREIAPTIEIAFFPIKGINEEELQNLIKEAVYIPAKNAKKDMFRLVAHGVILNG